MIILDTNVLSALMLQTPDAKVVTWLDIQPRISVWTTSIALLEVRYGLQIMAEGKRRTILVRAFEELLNMIEHRVVSFDAEAAEYAGALMASRQKKGRPGDLRDTMIAGIALAHRATLATRNEAHFEDIAGSVINPWTA